MSNHCHVFMFPSGFYNTISPGTSESESCVSASDPVPKKKAQQCTILCKICKNTVPSEGGTLKLFHCLRLKHTAEYQQSTEEEILTAGDMWPKGKQTTPLSFTGALTSCAPYDSKSKQWMKITDAATWWQSRALSIWLKRLSQVTTSQEDNIFRFHHMAVFVQVVEVLQG